MRNVTFYFKFMKAGTIKKSENRTTPVASQFHNSQKSFFSTSEKIAPPFIPGMRSQHESPGSNTGIIQRSPLGGDGSYNDPMDDPRMHEEGAPNAQSCTPPSHCPAGFCQAGSNESYMRHQMNKNRLILLGGIALAVDSRVLPLWRDYMGGGTDVQDLSGKFASDFSSSKSTQKAVKYLIDALKFHLKENPPTLAPNSGMSIDYSDALKNEIKALGTPRDPNRLNFEIPGEIPGNIAGDIGKDQTSCMSGAKPSPFNDERKAWVGAHISADALGNITVEPIIQFLIRDTVDLCPGNCGSSLEQFATIPLSQYEATGITGDVPFFVEFSVTPASFTLNGTEVSDKTADSDSR